MQEKGGEGLNDDAVTGQSGEEELCDRLCSITSSGCLTTEGQKMSVLMPEEG